MFDTDIKMNILLSLLLSTSLAIADSGFDRCEVTHCLCEVEQGAPPNIELGDPATGPRRVSIYFTENSSSLSESQRATIEELSQYFTRTEDVGPALNFTIIGYTDGCGSTEHNIDLATQRISSVATEIREHTHRRRYVRTIVHGEQTATHSPSARRVDIVIHNGNNLQTRIDITPADVYLIDGSGSMWENWREFTDVVNASYVPGSRIYMSMMTGCRDGQNLDRIRPQGGTEIWYSYWKVLDHMSEGETLLIVSDFDSNVPLTDREEAIIRAKAASRGIIVRTLR